MNTSYYCGIPVIEFVGVVDLVVIYEVVLCDEMKYNLDRSDDHFLPEYFRSSAENVSEFR